MHDAVRGCQMLHNDVIWRGWDNASLWNALLYMGTSNQTAENTMMSYFVILVPSLVDRYEHFVQALSQLVLNAIFLGPMASAEEAKLLQKK